MSAEYPVVGRSVIILVMNWIGRVLVACLAVSFCLMAYLAISAKPTLGDPDGIEQENHAFCSQFGMAYGAPRYDECAAALQKVREQQQKRAAAESLL
jgi:hypothetical protein